jgi:predicted lipid-binding transport protein (Tim44 family)
LIVTVLTRRFRSMLIALVVLGLSAGAVLAARPASVPTSSDQANQAEASPEPSESPEPSDAAQPSESPEPSDSAEPSAAANAAAADTSAGVHPDNHGLLVSQAAQSPTPSGFDNHGAYVRTIAMANHGHPTGPVTPKTHGKNH